MPASPALKGRSAGALASARPSQPTATHERQALLSESAVVSHPFPYLWSMKRIAGAAAGVAWTFVGLVLPIAPAALANLAFNLAVVAGAIATVLFVSDYGAWRKPVITFCLSVVVAGIGIATVAQMAIVVGQPPA